MPSVYLSYSREDAALAARVADALQSHDMRIQSDHSNHPDAPHATLAAAQSADAVVVLLTPNARQSRWVRIAWADALKAGVPVFPFILQGDVSTALPADFTGAPVHVAAHDLDFGVESIVTALCDHFDLPRAFEGYLRPFSPLAWLRVLRWVFLEPRQYLRYQAYAGEGQTRRVTGAMAAALIWLPLLATLLGYSFSGVPGSAAGGANLLFVVIVLLAWLGTALAGGVKGDLGGLWVVMGSATFFFVLPLGFALIGSTATQYTDAVVPFGYVVGGALVAAITIGCGVAIALSGDGAATMIGWGMSMGLTTGTALVVTGGLILGVGLAFAFAGGIVLGYFMPFASANILKRNLRDMSAAPRSRFLLAGLIAAYGLLLWVFALGGWTLLGG